MLLIFDAFPKVGHYNMEYFDYIQTSTAQLYKSPLHLWWPKTTDFLTTNEQFIIAPVQTSFHAPEVVDTSKFPAKMTRQASTWL